MIGAIDFNDNVNANDNLFPESQHLLYDWCHIVITIFGESATEDDVGLLCGKLAILVGEGVITIVVDRVIGFHALFVLRAVLFADNSLRTVVDILAKHLEMLVLDNASVGLVVTGVVDHGIALVVGCVFNAGLESDSAPVEFAELEAKILVNRAGKYELVGNFLPIIS